VNHRRKIFSLIREASIHIADNVKVIPKKDLEITLTSKELLKSVQEEAIQFKKEIVSECEITRSQAELEGFKAGYSKWVDKLVEMENEVLKVHADMEKMVLPLALEVAKKIVSKELEVSQSAILEILKKQLKKVAQHKKITIYAHPEDIVIVEKEREHIKKMFESLESLSLRGSHEIHRGGCVIETEGGIINAKIEDQWLILEKAFQKIKIPKQFKNSEEI
jgi:type III secretion protein L